MPFDSVTYRVLIASPSDLTEERQAATDAVNDWNALHSSTEGVVLLPVKWETHATPEAGVRPQAVINRDLVDPSDILIGMFWTQLGNSTGVAESGTIEEIDRFVKAGKPAMLYFSSRLIDPTKINIEQHQKLKTFKDTTYKTALCGKFIDTNGLKNSLHRDLTNTIRRLRKPSSPSAIKPAMPEPVQSGVDLGSLAIFMLPKQPVHYFETVDIESQSDSLDLTIKCVEPNDSGFVQELSTKKSYGVAVAFGSTAVACRVVNATLKQSAGKQLGVLKFKPDSSHAGVGAEMAYNNYSADQIAELRARRILLNEKVSGQAPSDTFNILDGLIRKSGGFMEVQECPLLKLYAQFGNNPTLFLALARLVSTMFLVLSNTVERIIKLDLDLRGATLNVNFVGQRSNPYSNREPAIITIKDGKMNF